MFQIVKFQNDECNATDATTGTCYTGYLMLPIVLFRLL